MRRTTVGRGVAVVVLLALTGCGHGGARSYTCDVPSGCSVCDEHIAVLDDAKRGTPAEICTATTKILNDDQYSDGEKSYVRQRHGAACACRREVLAIETGRTFTLAEIEGATDPILLKEASATLANAGPVGNRAWKRLREWLQNAKSPEEIRRVLDAKVPAAYSWSAIEPCRTIRTGDAPYAANGTDASLRFRLEELETERTRQREAQEHAAQQAAYNEKRQHEIQRAQQQAFDQIVAKARPLLASAKEHAQARRFAKAEEDLFAAEAAGANGNQDLAPLLQEVRSLIPGEKDVLRAAEIAETCRSGQCSAGNWLITMALGLGRFDADSTCRESRIRGTLLQALGPHTYEVNVRLPMSLNSAEMPIILDTRLATFESAGAVEMCVHALPSMKKVQLKNGFTRDVLVFTEDRRPRPGGSARAR